MILLTLLLSLKAFSVDLPMDYITSVKSGGDTTVIFDGESVRAFKNPAANIGGELLSLHIKGDSLFERNFSADPSKDLRGLGPVYNNTSCTACHTRDGRGALPVVPAGAEWVQLKQNEALFLRISIEDGKPIPKNKANNWGAPKAVPDFGTQLFHLSNFSVREDFPGVGQAKVWMKYESSDFTYPDRTVVKLKKPIFKITDAYNDRLYQQDVKTSPRMGTPMIGLGLLEAIPEEDILALAERDLSSEGVHGRPNYVLDREKEIQGQPYPVSLGRFGLKANTPTVFHQALGALNGDMGVTNYAFPIESIFGTTLFKNLNIDTSSLEATADAADALVFYSLTLAVPSRRNVNDPVVLSGAKLFHQVNCTSCHNPSFTTGPLAATPELAHQKIYPYTDMLLHDMGEGLADGRQDFDANGREWKTRALWGIGHTQTINSRAGFLHDGRAKTLEEAILWHGGEADYSKKKFINLTKADRDSVIKFLRSL